MKTYAIATIPGDGIGKEVVPAGQQVLEAIAATSGGLRFEFENFDWGGDYYRQHGVMMPTDGLETTKGLSWQTRQWEKNGEKDADPPAAPAGGYEPGKGDSATEDWKARNKSRQDDEFVEKYMKLRGVTRDLAEKARPAR